MNTAKIYWGAFKASSANWKNKLRTAGIARIAVVLSVFPATLVGSAWALYLITAFFGPAASALIDVEKVAGVVQWVGNLAIVFAALMLVAFILAALQAWTSWGIFLSLGLTLTGILWWDLKRILIESMGWLLPRPSRNDYLAFVDAWLHLLSISVSVLMFTITACGGYVIFRAMRLRLTKGEAALQNSRFGGWLGRDSTNLVREAQNIIAKRFSLLKGEVNDAKASSQTHTQKVRQAPQQKKSARQMRRASQRKNRRRK